MAGSLGYRDQGSREFQSWGAERLYALCPMVMSLVGGTENWRVKEGRMRTGVAMWRRSDKYGGARL